MTYDPRLKFFEDGRVICEHCMEIKERSQLFVDNDGEMWDICKDCATKEGWTGHGNERAT